jgi:hypothetical protein
MGSVGGILAIWLIIRALRTHPDERRFWISFVGLTALLGIAVHPNADALGVAQICGQPLVLLGVSFLAVSFVTLPPAVRLIGVLGLAFDFAVGVLLQFSLENRIFHVVKNVEGRPILGGGEDLSAWALRNWLDKQKWQVIYWGDYFIAYAPLIQVLVVFGFAAVLLRIATIGPRPE